MTREDLQLTNPNAMDRYARVDADAIEVGEGGSASHATSVSFADMFNR